MCQSTNRLLFVYSKSPIDYYKRVEKGREEGDTESVGQLQLSPTAESGDPPRELPRGNLINPRIILYVDRKSWPSYSITTTQQRLQVVCQFNYWHTISFFKCNIVYTKYEPKLIP